MKIIIALLILLLIGLQFRLWAGKGSFAEVDQLNDRLAVQIAENEELQARNDVLLNEISELRTGLDAIEERARNELGLIKEGETFYLIVDESDESDESEEEKDSAFQQLQNDQYESSSEAINEVIITESTSSDNTNVLSTQQAQ